MNKLLFIVGPTGTGKTVQAIRVAKNQKSVLISADSRQVYRGMDIVTGKDHPQDIPLFGIDLVNPDQPVSVAVWHDQVMPIIKQAWKDDKMPIIVGGTGLYLKSITGEITTMQVGINQPLRNELSTLSIPELQSRLKAIAEEKLANMNNSDLHNPRRLIRAIEVASSQGVTQKAISNPTFQSNFIGLKYSSLTLQEQAITNRVLSRLQQGAIEETKTLLKSFDPNLQSMTAIGYRSIIAFLDGKVSHSQMIDLWVADEFAYAKRQLTWFRKQDLIWYDIDKTKEIALTGV